MVFGTAWCVGVTFEFKLDGHKSFYVVKNVINVVNKGSYQSSAFRTAHPMHPPLEIDRKMDQCGGPSIPTHPLQIQTDSAVRGSLHPLK